jgi:hypothetical protein
VKVVTKTASNVEALFPSRQTSEDFAQSLDDFLDEVILVKDDGFTGTLQQAREKCLEKYKRFVNVLQEQPLIKSQVQRPDYVIGLSTDIVSARRDPLFMESLAQRTSQSDKDESREAYFERHFGCLVTYAQTLEIHDPWLLGNLSKQTSGISWMLSQRLSKYPIKLVLTGALPKYKRDASGKVTESRRDYDKRCDALLQGSKSFIKRLENCHPDFKLKLRVYPIEGSNKHDRFWRIAFQKGSVSVELSDGTEVFEKPRLPGRRKPHKLSKEEYEEKAASWESNEIEEKRNPIAQYDFSVRPSTGNLVDLDE